MELFRRLAVETAERWQYPYPASGDHAVTTLVGRLISEMNQTATAAAHVVHR
jgi:hypothetical protein